MSYVCSQCGAAHENLPVWACRAPDLWAAASEKERDEDFRLSGDFCSFRDEHYFVRCVLQIPVVDSDTEVFEFGVWSTLSAESFRRYFDTFDDTDQSKLGAMFGWFANRLDGYPDTLSLACDVLPQDNGQRPLIRFHDTDHPLAVQQREGVTLRVATDYLHARGAL
jgi:hypothetical protein